MAVMAVLGRIDMSDIKLYSWKQQQGGDAPETLDFPEEFNTAWESLFQWAGSAIDLGSPQAFLECLYASEGSDYEEDVLDTTRYSCCMVPVCDGSLKVWGGRGLERGGGANRRKTVGRGWGGRRGK
jgi:hypothetical protein